MQHTLFEIAEGNSPAEAVKALATIINSKYTNKKCRVQQFDIIQEVRQNPLAANQARLVYVIVVALVDDEMIEEKLTTITRGITALLDLLVEPADKVEELKRKMRQAALGVRDEG